MCERTAAARSLTASHDEVPNRNVKSRRQFDSMLCGDMITKINCMINKLNDLTGSARGSPTVKRNNEATVEEYETGRLLTLTTDTSSGHTLQSTSFQMETEVKHGATTSSASPVNGTKHPIMMVTPSEAPVFHGKQSESPRQFLIHVQDYVQSLHPGDRLTLPNGISQFLRESALQWYCQLQMTHHRQQTWEEFTNIFLIQFDPPIRRARREAEWVECKQRESETINEFLVRLRALWNEQKPNETETDLVKHLLCRIRNDLFNNIRISRNASLDEIVAEVQQIEEILHRTAKDERLSNQLEQLSLERTEILRNRRYNEGYSHKTTPALSNKYCVNKNAATPSRYLKNQAQRTVDTNTSQQLNLSGCSACGEYRHLATSCSTQYGDYPSRQSEPNPEKRQRSPRQKDQPRFSVNNSVKLLAQVNSFETDWHTNMNTRCIFCNISCSDYYCSQCSEMNRGLKFQRLRQLLESCSQSVMFYDEMNYVVKRIQQVSSLK